MSGWRYDTPLADLALVPPLAAALALAALRRHRFIGFLRLGRFDFLLAALLSGTALLLVAVGPTLWSKYFWAMRVDLLTLPLFAAAVVVLLFGARALVPLGFPILFLLLAWPLPYEAVLEHALSAFTQTTAWAVERVAAVAHVAEPVSGTDGSRYVVAHGGESVVVSVASACSGVNALVGFGVVGVAGLWLVRGRIVARIAWLLFGAALVWALNVVRIVAVLLAARKLGERAAFDLLHPVAGLLALNLGFVLLVRVLPLFGLRRRRFDEYELELVDSPLTRTAPPAQQARPGRAAVRLAAVAAATAALALANGQLGAAAKGLDQNGRPAFATFAERPSAGRGWRVRRVEEIGWAAPYYGRHSSWLRYRLRPTGAVAGRGRFTVWADAIVARDLGALDAYSLAHCYAFHRFQVRTSQRVTLGSGVVGRLFVYETKLAAWHAVAWEWPVLHGNAVDHERIVLLASARTRPSAQQARASWLARGVLASLNARAPHDDPNAELSRALVALAGQMVSVRVSKDAR